MIRSIETYFYIFLIYAIAGWTMETLGKLVRTKKFVNRGFLIGPYCPIYGVGVLIITFLLKKYENDLYALVIFSMLICGTLEYFTSFFMEKIFKARWWDYSNKRFNINGRICLETLIPFAIAGTVIIKVINPFLMSVISKIPNLLIDISTIALFILFCLDIVISLKIILGFKNITRELRDNTEEISEKVKNTTKEITEMIKNKQSEINERIRDNAEELTRRVKEAMNEKSILYKRLVKAFPNLVAKRNKNR